MERFLVSQILMYVCMYVCMYVIMYVCMSNRNVDVNSRSEFSVFIHSSDQCVAVMRKKALFSNTSLPSRFFFFFFFCWLF